MKKALRVILILSCIFFGTQRIKADKQWLQNIDFYVDKALQDHEWCFEGKTFINYDLLWISINDEGNFEYYLSANWQWYYVDERWNLSSSCKFSLTPVAVELAETKDWYDLINYRNPKNTLKTEKDIQAVFSENAYKNRRTRKNSIIAEENNALSLAESYFWVKLDEEWNFDCKFCDTTRYQFDNLWLNEYRYINQPGWDSKRFIFNSDWTMQRMWGNDWKYTRHFWKNNSTLIVKDPNNTWSLERFIIKNLKDTEMIFILETILL